ncbi:hypothetical protein RMATCC62417_00134 [Rhizopus microsporus]|nr:hypothetical protein RMATCC62417_00134 [Rhizopus microsporus]
MYIVALLSLASILGVSANSHCRSNAEVSWNVYDSSNGLDNGVMSIHGGKDGWTIPTVTAMKALSDCVFNFHGCSGVWTDNSYWKFSCNGGGMKWKQGVGSIEFNCSDGPYTCENFHST